MPSFTRYAALRGVELAAERNLCGPQVVFLVDAKTEDEARALMETLPLAKENLMDHVYIPVGPLMPLRALMGAAQQ
jgi:hypothetical protein